MVTASRDLSLRILTWRNDPEHGLTLESQYHLLGGSLTRSRYRVIAHTVSSFIFMVHFYMHNILTFKLTLFIYISRGFTSVACDHSSIVGCVESVDGNDVLKAYTFDF